MLKRDSESDGALQLQFDKAGYFLYVSQVDKIGDGMQALYSFYSQNRFVGGFRAANSEFTYDTGARVFAGKCREWK